MYESLPLILDGVLGFHQGGDGLLGDVFGPCHVIPVIIDTKISVSEDFVFSVPFSIIILPKRILIPFKFLVLLISFIIILRGVWVMARNY